MKKLILCLLIPLQITAVLAQDAKIIQKDFQNLIGYTRKMEIDKALDMSYPPIFKIMPKAQMSAMTKGAISSMGLKTTFEDVPIGLTLSPVTKLKAATICLGKYNQSVIMESSKTDMINMMAKAKMKDNTVEKLAPGKIRIKGKNYFLAIKDAHTNNTWKYLRYDNEDVLMNSKVLSKEITDAAAKLKVALNVIATT